MGDDMTANPLHDTAPSDDGASRDGPPPPSGGSGSPRGATSTPQRRLLSDVLPWCALLVPLACLLPAGVFSGAPDAPDAAQTVVSMPKNVSVARDAYTKYEDAESRGARFEALARAVEQWRASGTSSLNFMRLVSFMGDPDVFAMDPNTGNWMVGWKYAKYGGAADAAVVARIASNRTTSLEFTDAATVTGPNWQPYSDSMAEIISSAW